MNANTEFHNLITTGMNQLAKNVNGGWALYWGMSRYEKSRLRRDGFVTWTFRNKTGEESLIITELGWEYLLDHC